MSVIDVKEDWREGDAGFDPEDGQSRRVWTVLFDEGDEPKNRPGLACFATGIPRMYQWHPFTPWLWVCNVQARAIGPLLFEVEVSYKIGRAESWQGEENPLTSPLDEPPERSWGFVVSEIPAQQDINGKVIENSSGEPFDPPITVQVYDLTYRVIRNEGAFDAVLATLYIGTVNSDYFGGFAPRTVKCTEISAREVRIGQFTFYQVAYEFILRTDTWVRKIVDEGMSKITGVNDDGTPKTENIKDDKGNQVTEPRKLDGSGNVLPKDAPKELLDFTMYKEMPFSNLGL